jgi:hypothetical protein
MLKKNSKFCPLGTKNERKYFAAMKTNDFILQKQKVKLAIKVESENIFYPVENI